MAGDRLIVLAAGRPQTEVRVETVGKPPDVPDCVNVFRAEQPSRIARLRLPRDLQDEVVFALRPGFLVVGGPPSRLSAVDTQRWVRTLSSSLPARWRSPNVLVHAYQYGTSGGHNAAVELYLGLATLNPAGASPPIRSVVIRRTFIIEGKVLASEEFERESGREERVDTQAPQLTFENWSASETERTVAFVTGDRGRSWIRLSTNEGFEGINWFANLLDPSLSEIFHHYLYTSH